MENIEAMRGQIRSMGASFDWTREVVSAQPDYYKWTQWLFLQLYKNGLAYKQMAPVNSIHHIVEKCMKSLLMD